MKTQTTIPQHFRKMSSVAQKRRNDLRATAAETKAILPTIFSQISALDCTEASIHHLKYLPELDPKLCPGYELPDGDPEAGRKGTRIRVYDQDTFDAALELQPGTTVRSILSCSKEEEDVEMKDVASDGTAAPESDSNDTTNTTTTDTERQRSPVKPVAVLNLASEKHAGGGWQNGALAQEEALCYRSSLYRSLRLRFYPLPTLSALYSPSVIIIRDAMSRGHTLFFPSTAAQDLPLTSVITLAAIRRPALGSGGKYAKSEDVELMKDKVRLALRLAVLQAHRKVVLGALGCGAFGNPPLEVAQLFLDVFHEEEFRGGWWEDVVFAVLDNARGDKGGKDGVGNFGVFYRALDGIVV